MVMTKIKAALYILPVRPSVCLSVCPSVRPVRKLTQKQRRKNQHRVEKGKRCAIFICSTGQK